MEEYQKRITLGTQEFLATCLSQPLALDAEIYPGDPKPERQTFSEISQGWLHYVHKIGDHNFQPHADAPNHQNPGCQNQGMEHWNIGYHFSRACLIDLSNSSRAAEFEGIKFLIEVRKEDLLPAIEKMRSRISAVIIRTGYDKWIEANKPHVPERLPYLAKDAAELLKQFKVIGIDSLTVDMHGRHTAHQILANSLLVESMVHLHAVLHRDFFDLITAPIAIKGATGGPVAAYALTQ